MEAPEHMPMPPEGMGVDTDAYLPALDMPAWIQAHLVDPDAASCNPDHTHLQHARLAVLWASQPYEKKGRQVAGEAREGEPTGSNKWTKGARRQQIKRWFGYVPDFLITLDANWWWAHSPRERLAVLEHELYHCAQKKNEFGAPAFDSRTGRPRWTIRAHDVEEFTGVVRRYGAHSKDLRDMQEALESEPEMGSVEIDALCGTCMKRAA